MKVTSTNHDSYQKYFIYGPSGSGKTSLAKTTTKEKKTVIVSTEKGLLCLADEPFDVLDITLDDNGKNVPVLDRRHRLQDVYKLLATPASQAKYGWVFLDTISEISQNVVSEYLKKFPEKKDSHQLWANYLETMRGIIKAFRDLPYNVVITALSRNEINKTTGVTEVIAEIQGRLSPQLPAYFDELLYMDFDDKTKERRLYSGRTSRIILPKDRSGKLNASEPPDLTVIYNKIKGGKK